MESNGILNWQVLSIPLSLIFEFPNNIFTYRTQRPTQPQRNEQKSLGHDCLRLFYLDLQRYEIKEYV